LPRECNPRHNNEQNRWAISLGGDGKTVCAALRSGDIGIFDATSGRQRLLRGPESDGAHVALSPDGQILAVGTDRPRSSVRLWEIATGKLIFLRKGHQGAGSTIAWSHDGRLIATADERIEDWHPIVAQTVRLWDAASATELACFGGFKADVTAMTFSPGDKTLSVGLRDGTILIFDVSKANQKLTTKLNAKELEQLWIELNNDDAGNAHRALGTLVAAPTDAVPLLSSRLKPALEPDAAKIARWIADLDSDQFAVRQAAAKELENVGPRVEPPIQKALQGKISLETRRRLEQVVKSLPDVPDPNTVRLIRAIIVLERIGSTEARRILESLARGAPGARETEEAKASLIRLAQRTVAYR
jgi:hypothetical protein